MTSIGIGRLEAATASHSHLPRGVGLALGALVSLGLWAVLIRGVLALLGA